MSQKPEKDRATPRIKVPLDPGKRNRYERAAKGLPLTKWINLLMDRAAGIK